MGFSFLRGGLMGVSEYNALKVVRRGPVIEGLGFMEIFHFQL